MPGLVSSAPPSALELPPLASCSQDDLSITLSHLRAFLTPPIHGFAHGGDHKAANTPSFERTLAIRWLTSFAHRFAQDESLADLVDQACALIAMSSAASAGAVTRTFDFRDDLRIFLSDAPLDSDGTNASVGLQTWGSSFVLASRIATAHEVLFRKFPSAVPRTGSRRLRILELGAGTGLVSLTLAKLGLDAEIVATDHHPRVIANLERNMVLNGLDNLQVRHLDWSHFVQPEAGQTLDTIFAQQFDVIFAADVVYEMEQCGWLAACVRALLVPETGVFHLVVPVRPTHPKETQLVETTFATPTLGSVHNALITQSREDVHPEDQADGVAQTATFRHYTIAWSSSEHDITTQISA